jgi:hypothetical protein
MMCWTCDHPASRRREYLARVREVIAADGWAVHGIEPDRMHPRWAYTVGLTGCGKPELVVTGLPVTWAAEVLAGAAGRLLGGGLRPGERLTLDGGTLVEVVRVADATAHLVVAAEIFGPGIKALQVVHRDERGRWPWDAGYPGAGGRQPVLGLRQPVAA